LSLQGGGALSLDSALGAGLDLYEYITEGKNFSNPFEAGLAAANLIGNLRDMGSEGFRQGGLSLLTDTIGGVAGIDVSGVAKTVFPKSNGTGGLGDIAIATAAVAGLSALSTNTGVSTSTGDTNPQTIEDQQFANYKKTYLNNGGTGGINGARTSFDSLSAEEKLDLL